VDEDGSAAIAVDAVAVLVRVGRCGGRAGVRPEFHGVVRVVGADQLAGGAYPAALGAEIAVRPVAGLPQQRFVRSIVGQGGAVIVDPVAELGAGLDIVGAATGSPCAALVAEALTGPAGPDRRPARFARAGQTAAGQVFVDLPVTVVVKLVASFGSCPLDGVALGGLR